MEGMDGKWFREIGAGIVVCDAAGVVLSMNEMAVKIFGKSGGRDLIGRNIRECHPEGTQKQLDDLFESRRSYCYMLDIGGARTMLFQNPWYENGAFMGFVEFIFRLPEEVPVRRGIRWVKKP